MNLIHRLMFPTLFALALGHSAAGASTGAVETDRLAEAKRLYVRAVPMAVESPQRAELLKQAETLLRGIIADNPRSLEAHRKLLGVYLLRNDYRQGIRTLQDAIRLSPGDPRLFVTLAFLYEHSGAYRQSEAMLTQALTLDPDHRVAREYLDVIRDKIAAQREGRHHGERAMGQGMPAGHGTPDPHAGLAPAVHGAAVPDHPEAARP